jgi:anti-sigma factor RsiW
MAECRDLESLFAPYVDGEALPVDRGVMDTHLRNCPSCRDRVSSEQEIRQALVSRRETLRAAASVDLRRRCAAAAHAAGASGQAAPAALAGMSATRRAWIPLSMAATILLAVAGVFFYGLRGGGEALAAQLVVDHVKCFEFAPEPTLLPNAQALAREWQTARGWTLKLPENKPSEELELIGVRRCISTRGTTAHVMYKWHGKPLSVYVLNHEDKQLGTSPRLIERLGQEPIMWCARGRTYAVVARGRVPDVEHVAEYVRLSAE